MNNKKKSFVLYYDQQRTFEALTDNEAGELIKTIFKHVQGQQIDLSFNGRRELQIALIPILQTLERDGIKYEERCKKNKENASKRWESANECERMQMSANYADSDSVSDSVNDNDSDSENILPLNKEIIQQASDFFGS